VNRGSIRSVFGAVALLAVSAASANAAPAVRLGKVLPDCDDTNFTDAEIHAAIKRAEKKLKDQGIVVDNLNSPNFIRLAEEVGKELGCRMGPEGHPDHAGQAR